MASSEFKLEGFRECREALQELSRRVQTGVGQRALRVPAEMVREATAARAPVSTSPYDKTPGSLKAAPVVVPQRRNKIGPLAAVLVSDPAAVPQEYGTTRHPAQPFMRPAVDAVATAAIIAFGQALKPEVEAAAARAAKRAAKAK